MKKLRYTEEQIAFAPLLGELDAIVGQDCMDAVEHGFQVFEDLPRCRLVNLVDRLDDRKLAGAVDAGEQIEFALGCLRFGDINMEEANGIASGGLTLWLVASAALDKLVE